MEVFVLVVVEGIRNVERAQSRSPPFHVQITGSDSRSPPAQPAQPSRLPLQRTQDTVSYFFRMSGRVLAGFSAISWMD